VIVNARAGRARRDPAIVDRLEALLPKGCVHATHDATEVESALDALRADGCDTLVVVGGDGSINGTLTPLLRSWPVGSLPAVVVTPGGTVNTVARSLGARGTPEGIVERLRGGAPSIDARRAVVEVRADAGAPAFGLVFVNGVGVRWLELYYARPRLGVRAAAAVVSRIAGSAIVGGALAKRLFESFEAEVVVDGDVQPDREYTIMAASGVKHVGLGFQPFFTAGSDPRRIHFATTGASAARLVTELPALRAGMNLAGSALTHHSAQRVEVRTRRPATWSLDAETFPAASHLEIAAGPALRFVQP
jgi:diacylglycerol kinase family enzyme